MACWQDQSGNGYNATHATGGQQPIYRANRLNTHPTLEFDGSNDRLATLNLQLFATGNSGLTAFTVFDTDNNATQRFVIAKGVSNVCADEFELGYDTGSGAGSGNFGLHRGCSRAIVAPANTIANNTFNIMSTHVLTTGTTPNNLDIYQNQTSLTLSNNSSGWLNAGAYDTSLEPLNVGTRRDGGSYNAYHDGDIVEIVIYTDELDPAERGQVASYLALKYGVTLDSIVDYLASDGTVVYASTGSHSGYVNDIAGIGLGSASTLTQTTSRSINSDSMVTITGTLASLSDGEFLVWGNDDGALTGSAEVPGSSPSPQRLTREWRAAETGEVGSVDLSFDLSGVSDVDFSRTAEFALLIDSDGDFSDATPVTGATVNGSVVTFSGTGLSDGDYFSLAYPVEVDLQVTKTVNPTTAQPGDPITYTLTFANNGAGIATNVVITDAMPVSVTNVSVISSGVSITDTGAATDFAWNVQDLAPTEGGVITLTGVLSDPLAAGVFTNTAIITSTGVDTDTTNNERSAVVTVVVPEMVVNGNGQSITNGDTTSSTTDDTDFGDTLVAGGSVVRTFTISNTGDATLTLSGSPAVTLTNSTHFSVTTQPGSSSIPGGGSTTFQITFDPATAGSFQDTVNISNNDANENPYTFVISGTGTAPEMVVNGNDLVINDGDTTSSTTDDTDFDDTLVAGGSVVRTFTISNTGDAALTLTGTPAVTLTTGAHFSVTTQPGSSSIPGGGSTTFQITFDPATAGSFQDTVNISNNDANENPYTFVISGTGSVLPVNLSVSANSGTEADETEITVTATASANVSSDQTVSLGVSGTGITGGDYDLSSSTITILTGQSSGVVTFTVQNDTTVEGNEIATLTISNPSAGLSLGTTTSQNVAITDNDVQYAIAADLPSVAEGNTGTTPITFTVTRSGAYTTTSGTVSFTLGGTAGNGSDYNNVSPASSVSFNTGAVSQTITMDVLGDYVDENVETISATLSNPTVSGSGTATLGTDTAQTSINDNDSAGITVDPTSGLVTNEFGLTDTFTIVLTSQPTDTVTVDLSSSNTDEGTVSPANVSFTTLSWNVPQTVTVTGADDAVIDGSQIYTIVTAAAVSSDSNYNNMTVDDVSVTNQDNDTPTEIDVQGNGQSITNGDTTPDTADDTDFGSMTLGDTPVTHTFTISNSGTGDLILSGSPAVTLTTGTHFSVTAQPGSSTIDSNSSTTFDITFNPASAGSFTDTVTIANNDSDENPYTFVISGTGVEAGYDLVVSKTAAGMTISPPTTTITYTVSVHNLSTSTPATGVVISDTLPLAVTFVTSSTTNGSAYNPTTGVWDVGTVNAGSGVTLTLVVKGNNLVGQQIVNIAELTQSSPPDVIAETNSAEVTIRPSIFYLPVFLKDSAP